MKKPSDICWHLDILTIRDIDGRLLRVMCKECDFDGIVEQEKGETKYEE